MIICMKLRFQLPLLLLSIGLAALFAGLAAVVHARTHLAIDHSLLTWVGQHTNGALDTACTAVTQLAEWPVVLGFAAVLVGVLYRRHQTSLVIMTAVALLGSMAINTVLKHLFSRARPELWEHLVHESSFAFPSGHAMASMTLALVIVHVGWHSRWRLAASILAAAYVLIIGFTRLYLSVHYPSDILGGWLAAAAWVLLVISIHSGSKRYTV